jgi:hypothetical protein
MRRILATAIPLALTLTALFAGVARADTTFGGAPTGAVSNITCADGTPDGRAQGSPSCTWYWFGTGAANSGDYVPFGPPGGTGTITSVTLPAMPHPGQMQVDVLTSTAIINQSREAEAACCSVKAISAAFTVPANQVTTVPLDLPVSSTPNIYQPGETQKSDIVAISVLDGTSTFPLRYTGVEKDFDRVAFPAITTTTSQILPLPEAYEVEVMASYTLGPPQAVPVAPLPTPTPTPAAPTPTPTPSPLAGVALAKHTLGANKTGRTVVLGKATNPPTTGTVQTLTGLLPRAHRRRARAAAAAKPVVLGRGKTVVPAGKSAPISITLTAAARRALAAGAKLTATEKVVATGTGGTKTSTATVHLAPRSK